MLSPSASPPILCELYMLLRSIGRMRAVRRDSLQGNRARASNARPYNTSRERVLRKNPLRNHLRLRREK